MAKLSSPLQGMDPKSTLGPDQVVDLLDENRRRHAGCRETRDREYAALQRDLATAHGGPGSPLHRRLQVVEEQGRCMVQLDKLYRKFQERYLDKTKTAAPPAEAG